MSRITELIAKSDKVIAKIHSETDCEKVEILHRQYNNILMHIAFEQRVFAGDLVKKAEKVKSYSVNKDVGNKPRMEH